MSHNLSLSLLYLSLCLFYFLFTPLLAAKKELHAIKYNISLSVCLTVCQALCLSASPFSNTPFRSLYSFCYTSPNCS